MDIFYCFKLNFSQNRKTVHLNFHMYTQENHKFKKLTL